MWAILVITAIPMVLFAVKISGRVPEVWLRRIFFILMLVIAIRMLLP